MESNIIMYAKHGCPYCERAEALLKQKNVSFTEIFVDDHPEKRDEMIKRSNGGHTVPQIFINDHHVGGSDDLLALEAAGKLDDMLSNK